MLQGLRRVGAAIQMNPPDDIASPDRLVERARSGDHEAFEAIYRAHAPRVHAVCLRLSADPAQAAELTQDTFVRVWQKLAAFRGESALGTWIHRVAVTTALERRRSDQRRVARVEPASDLAALPSAARVEPLEERMDLEAALAALPDTVRTVFVLREIEGYDYREISELTGTSEVALRSQLFRARRLIMEMLHL